MEEAKDLQGETGGENKVEAGGLEEELKKLKEQLKAKEDEARGNHDRFLRSCAELENFKKRSAREKEEFIRFSMEKMVKELLPVLDNLERAVEHSKSTQDFDGLVEGVGMTVKLFHQCLDRFGVAPVTSLGEKFDPTRHEAIMQVEEGDHDADTVVGEHQKGYTFNERLLRPCLVTVARSRSKPQDTDKETDTGE